MRLFELETDENSIYFVYINSNPPTFGYKNAFNMLKDLSKDGEHLAFINNAYDGEAFPLKFEESLKFNKKVFPDINFSKNKNISNPIQALKELSKKYTKIYFLVRDKDIKKYRRMYQYAENWGVESFELIGLGDSTRTLPTGKSKQESLDAVIDGDYDSFKKTIPTKNSKVLSDLYLTLRNRLLDEKDDKTDVNECFLKLYLASKYTKYQMNESTFKDRLGNKVLSLGNIISGLDDLQIVFNKHTNKLSLGKKDNNYVIMMNTKPEQLQSYLDVNEDKMKDVLELYLKESISSTSVASTNMPLFKPLSRDIDYSFIDDIKKSNSLNKRLDAINHVINTYHIIDGDIVNEIESRL